MAQRKLNLPPQGQQPSRNQQKRNKGQPYGSQCTEAGALGRCIPWRKGGQALCVCMVAVSQAGTGNLQGGKY